MVDDIGPHHFYRHSGLVVRSDIPLPEWEAFRATGPDTESDVLIRLEDPVASVEERLPQVDGNGIVFSVAGIGRWCIAGGNRILITPVANAGVPELRLFTLGSAWGALGYQRGLTMLHGSAVRVKDRTLLFCGTQEQGKSTIAAALVARGGTLVADDLARVDPPAGEGRALAWPSSTRMKLWREAVAHFGWDDRIAQRDHFRDDKFHLALGSVAGCEPGALHAIIVLVWGEQVRLDRLTGGDAVGQVLQASCYRPDMLEAMDLTGAYAAQVARIVGATPVWRLTRPRDFARLDAVCDLVQGM